jgi:valyl-tRNA synthetase
VYFSSTCGGDIVSLLGITETGSEDFVIAKTKEEALTLATSKAGRSLSTSELKQDEDVLDTWFSSWLWPISVFNGLTNPGNDEIKYYYPTNDLVTAPEIMFFWVATNDHCWLTNTWMKNCRSKMYTILEL